MSATTHTWNGETYHRHSSAQQTAADTLLELVQLKGDENIVDVGCGDGKITAKIAKKVPAGTVQGIDLATGMIEFANKSFPRASYPNLTFSAMDANDIDRFENINVLFSSFALQWLANPAMFFEKAHSSLCASGILAVTIPLGISTSLDAAIKIVTQKAQWEGYFKEFSPGWHFCSADQYKAILSAQQFVLTHFAVVDQQQVFPSKAAFEHYVLQWFSYLKQLPEEQRSTFFNEIIDCYLRLAPPLADGQVLFRFSRVDIVAKKATR